MKNKTRGWLSLAILSVVLITNAAYQVGCGTLNKSGVYAGNNTLYAADLTISSAYELLHSFVSFELQARDSLPPEVRQAADRIRAGAPQWFASALALRDAYKGNPTQASSDNLQKALDVLRAAVAEATHYLIQTQQSQQQKG